MMDAIASAEDPHIQLLREIEAEPDGDSPLLRHAGGPVVVPTTVDHIFHEILQLRLTDYLSLRKQLDAMV